MKRFVEITVMMKSIAAMAFSGQVIVYVVLGSLWGLDSLPFYMAWQFLFISLIASVLQFVFFTEYVIEKMKGSVRLALFGASLILVLSAFASIFSWFPTGNVYYWIVFVALFLVAFSIINIVLEIYFRITGKRFNDSLEQYKSKSIR